MNKLFLACILSFTIAQKDTRGDFDQDELVKRWKQGQKE